MRRSSSISRLLRCFYCHVSLIPAVSPTLSPTLYPSPLAHKISPIIMLSVCFSLLHSHIRAWFRLAFSPRFGKEEKLFVGKIMGIFHPLSPCLPFARAGWQWEKLDVTTRRSKSHRIRISVSPSETDEGEMEIIRTIKVFSFASSGLFIWHGASITGMMIKLFSWLTAPAAQAKI